MSIIKTRTNTLTFSTIAVNGGLKKPWPCPAPM